jgi:hypothetical protein
LYSDDSKIKGDSRKRLASQLERILPRSSNALAAAGTALTLFTVTTAEATPADGAQFEAYGVVNEINVNALIIQGSWEEQTSIFAGGDDYVVAVIAGDGSGDLLTILASYVDNVGSGGVDFIDLIVTGLTWEGESPDAVPEIVVTTPVGWDVLTAQFFDGNLEFSGQRDSNGDINAAFTFQFVHPPSAEVPEPGTWALMGSMLAAAGALRRKQHPQGNIR